MAKVEEKEKDHPMTEMVTFLPKDESALTNGAGKYELTKAGDAEAAKTLTGGEFDPFKARVLEHPVSETATLIHLLKSCLGTGILAMPIAFKSAGLLVGIFATLVESLICCHCAYVLVICAHELYRRAGKTALTFADVAEEACVHGPAWARGFGTTARWAVDVGIFVTYFGTCSAYAVIVAKNLDKVAAYYWGEYDVRLYILALLVPLIILCYTPNLKYLTPVSMASNAFMGVGLLVTCYFLVTDLPAVRADQLSGDISQFPAFFSITIFALEAIGVVMPLENNMRRPQKFVGICGVLNQGMAAVTILYIIIGFLGYLRFGDLTEANVTLNLPASNYAAQSVQILIALAIFGTFGIQFFVCLEIAWRPLSRRFRTRATLANYALRTVMVTAAVMIAVAVPTIGPFIGLIGAFGFSILGLIIPILIEVLTFWERGFGPLRWRLVKDVVVVVTGLLALVFGSKSALSDIYALYATTTNPNNGTEAVLLNGTAGQP